MLTSVGEHIKQDFTKEVDIMKFAFECRLYVR